MHYSSLAELYENLNSTSLKLKKTRSLAEFLENTPPDEIENIILLCMGRVFPEWSEKELGIASLLMVKTLSKSYGVPEKKIGDAWKESGDLGLVAEEFSGKKKQKVLFAPKLNVDKVVSNLQKAAELSGARSQERKMGLIG
ncbi:MAG: DNA ligase, partial [Candidatus Aenigmarchaeota archaeon]|nr:DNA ligase [Candidatus Aenigmarchaeota archaeon]